MDVILNNKPAMLVTWAYTFHSWEMLGMKAWMPAFLSAATAYSTGSSATAAASLGAGLAAIAYIGSMGGSVAGGKFQDALQLVTRLVNIGDCKTLACHPATTTHRQLGPEEMAKAGVSEDMIRLSVGIEHVDDLIADLDQALNAA